MSIPRGWLTAAPPPAELKRELSSSERSNEESVRLEAADIWRLIAVTPASWL
jgi:hypothetical protein